jgi:hypothetical protein
MKTRMKLTITVISLMLVLVASAFAQGPPGGRRPGGRPPGGGPPGGGPPPDWVRGPGQGRPPDGGRNKPPQGFKFLSPEMRFESKVVKGLAYKAEAVTENTQILGDGTRITRKTTSAIYRDSEGRTRREVTLDSIGPLAPTEGAQKLVFINDPVASVHYVLSPQDHTVRKMDMSTKEPPVHPEAPASTEGTTESLGKKLIEGVAAEGTRSTITIPAGQIGNDRPILIVSERWYSQALQTVVLSKHSDPRVGENIYRLTNINRTEPAKSLFELPADYKVEEGRFPPPRPLKDGHRRPDDF